jgi:predicted acetyltransferase
MIPEIRPITQGETAELMTTLAIAAGRPVETADTAPAVPGAVHLAAFDRGRMVGGSCTEPVELTVPGPATVPAAKIGLTGLLPTHRYRGIASALIRRQLNDLYRSGTPLAVGTAAESNVPGRHGFAVATRALAVAVTPRATPPEGEPAGSYPTVDLIPPAEAVAALPPVYERHRRSQVGQVSRSADFWASWFDDRPALRVAPADRCFAAAYDRDRAIQGYLSYRLARGPLRERPVEALVVEDLIAATDPARRALWSFCLGFDQASRVTAWNLPVDEPAGWLLPDPRQLRVEAVRPFLRLRLVDVAVALGARRYPVADQLVLEVDDPVLTGNAGRFRLRGEPERAGCERTTDQPDLSLSVVELAATYLGDVDLLTLARAGRVSEHTPGALARASLLFTSRPAPWTVTDW